MARLSDDDFAALRAEIDDDTARALGEVRRAHGARRNEATTAWLAAGDTLAEKAVAALDTGDHERAVRLVQRIVSLPLIDDGTRSGLMAVSLLLYNEVLDPTVQEEVEPGLLDAPLRLLPTLDPAVATELRRVLASFTDYALPAATVRRIRAVVPLERRFDAPFAGVAEQDLPAAVTGVLRLVLRLRGAEG